MYVVDGICFVCQWGICSYCIAYNECLACKPETFRYLSGTKCLCYLGYYDDQALDYVCNKCHNTCRTCLGSEISDCLTCDSSIHRTLMLDQCVSDSNYGTNSYDSNDPVCK